MKTNLSPDCDHFRRLDDFLLDSSVVRSSTNHPIQDFGSGLSFIFRLTASICFARVWKVWWNRHQRLAVAIVTAVAYFLSYSLPVEMGISAASANTGSTNGASVANGANVNVTGTGGITQPIPTVTTAEGLVLPDWDQINFNNLPPMMEDGSVTLPPNAARQLGIDPNISWNAGDQVSSVVKGGMVRDLGVGELNLSELEQLSQATGGTPLAQVNLSDFGVIPNQTASTLAQAVPNLSEQLVSQVAPIQDLMQQALNLDQNLGGYVAGIGGISNLKVGELIQQFPDVARLPLSSLDLSQYGIDSIPNLDITNLKDFPGWENVTLSEIPNLPDVPLADMPSGLDEGTDPFIARVDVPLDNAEQSQDRSLSGSYQAGFRVACDTECTHAELSPIGGSQMDAASTGAFANGKVWMARNQMVPGGFGILQALNGGLEPTGRNPYGSVFKQVIINIDQAAGQTATGMYFRFCKRGMPDLGCTPYFLGPIPFLIYPEQMMIYLGNSNAQDDGNGINLPGQRDPLRGTDGFRSCGATLSGDAVERSISAVDKVAATVNDGRFSTSSDLAREHIPRILAALKEEGITCPAQVAYILSTVHGETSYVHFEEADTRYESDSEGFWGRGYLQTTHRDAYERVRDEFGVDVVSNPDILTQDMDLAARVLARGFKEGWYAARIPIDEAIPCDGQVDYVAARQMINDNAQAQTYADAAVVYYDALTQSGGLDNTTTEQKGDCGGSNTAPAPCAEGQTCKMQNPLPNNTGVYSPYGPRGGRLHAGIDIQTQKGVIAYDSYPSTVGEEVLAAYRGTVSELVPVGGRCGGIVAIMHPDLGLETRYVHLAQVFVQSGQAIERGQVVGMEGMEGLGAGCAAGIHLHYEIYVNGSPVDPMGYADQHEPPLFYQ